MIEDVKAAPSSKKLCSAGKTRCCRKLNDHMRRVSVNNSRKALKPEGIIILEYDEAHTTIARELGIPIPGPNQFVPVRVVPAMESDAAKAKICDSFWRVALPSDPIVCAPELPKVKARRKRKRVVPKITISQPNESDQLP